MIIQSHLKSYEINDFKFKGAYTFTNENKNNYFLLNEDGCSIIFNKKLYNKLKNKDLTESMKFKLIQHGMATIEGLDKIVSYNEDNSIYFIIDTTKKCNLNCMYCFRDLNDKREITEEKLEDICKFILNILKERNLNKVNIQMWGGEPILAISKIEYVYNFFNDKNINVKIDIETNGSLITDKIAKKLYNLNVSIGVSIDGTKKHQDLQRKLINNKGSMNLVEKGIQNLQKYYGNNIGGITVITKYNYKDIAEIISYFINDLKIRNMKFNIVKDNPNAEEDGIGLNIEEVKEFANNLFDTLEIYEVLGLEFSEGNIEMRKDNLLKRSNFSCCISNGCKGGRNLISIDMNGDLYPCEMMDYKDVKLGSIYNNDNLIDNKELINQLKQSEEENIFFKEKINKECKKCPWSYYCKGGCTSRIFYSEGKMKYDIVECEFNKIIYLKIINKFLKNIDSIKK